jgi:hypothetical protein
MAVFELGLTGPPVSDFSSSTSMDSALYAIKKSLSAPLDHQVGKYRPIASKNNSDILKFINFFYYKNLIIYSTISNI